MKTTVADAIGHALKDLGVDIVTNVPGYGASEAFQSYKKISMRQSPISFHEEVAYTISHGASIVGKRSACLIKAHGFAKAANSVIDSLYTKITAGFVTIIFDDKVGSHSDNVMETKAFLHGMSFPYSTGKLDTIYLDVISAFHTSEKTNLPHVLIIDAADIDEATEFEPRQNLQKKFVFERDILSHVVHPLFADYQYKVFTAHKLNGDPNSIPRPTLPLVPYDLPENIKKAALQYQSFFEVFNNFRGDIVTGDTSASSSYALPTYDAIDIVTYIGGSIPLAIGSYLAGKKYTWALTGDFGFIAAGHLGLLEAVLREIPLKIVIFNNKQAAATGGQQIQKVLLLKLLTSYQRFIKNITNPKDPIEISEVLEEATSSDNLRIILLDY